MQIIPLPRFTGNIEREFNILFVTPNHQTTNLVSPNFFLEFFSDLSVEKELFKLVKLRKFRGKNLGKQNWLFGGLMSRTR